MLISRAVVQNSRNKKEVVSYDYVDFEVPVLVRMYDRRIKGYRSIGCEIEED